jgi:hypothetical protein
VACATIGSTPNPGRLKGGIRMEVAIMIGAAGLALLGAALATRLTNGTDDWAGQVKKAERSRAKMKKALSK